MALQTPPYAPDNITARPLEHYRELFRAADPAEISARTGAAFDGKAFTLRMLGEERRVDYPLFEEEGWKDKDRILALRYLLEGHESGASESFVTYRQLPWGAAYDGPFHARCINRLAATFGKRPAAFAAACEAFGGTPTGKNCTGYELEFMPGLRMQFLLWEADDEFPASAQILYSDNFPRAFSGEDCVIVCEYILGRLTRYKAPV